MQRTSAVYFVSRMRILKDILYSQRLLIVKRYCIFLENIICYYFQWSPTHRKISEEDKQTMFVFRYIFLGHTMKNAEEAFLPLLYLII